MWMLKDKRLEIAVIRRVTSRLRSRPGELVTRWPGPGAGQWETFSYFRRLPGDCSRYITFTSPAPLLLDPQSEVQWVEASLGRQQPALWHSAGYSDSTPAISNVAVHWRFSDVQRSIGTILLCTFILWKLYIPLRVGFCLSNLEPRHVFKVLKLLYESTWQRPPLWAVSGDYGE